MTDGHCLLGEAPNSAITQHGHFSGTQTPGDWFRPQGRDGTISPWPNVRPAGFGLRRDVRPAALEKPRIVFVNGRCRQADKPFNIITRDMDDGPSLADYAQFRRPTTVPPRND